MADNQISPPEAPHLVLRADAGALRGFGHVMRCMTLGAEFRRRGWRVTLHTAEINRFLCGRADSYGINVQMVSDTPGGEKDARLLVETRAEIHVLDGYHFDQSFLDRVCDSGSVVVVVDDTGREVPAGIDYVLNQNLHAAAVLYPGVESDRLLLGSGYAMVRNEVLEARTDPTAHDDNGQRERVVVGVGGTDVLGLTDTVAKALTGNPQRTVYARALSDAEGVAPLPEDPATALAAATVAVIGGGSTMWETFYLGVPSVVLVVADNQVPSAETARDLGIVELLDCRTGIDHTHLVRIVDDLTDNPERRSEMKRRGQQLIDGLGVGRVADAILKGFVA